MAILPCPVPPKAYWYLLVKFTILKYKDDIINFLVHSTKKTRIGARYIEVINTEKTLKLIWHEYHTVSLIYNSILYHSMVLEN